MTKPGPADLSKRERQIMDLVYQLGQATAAEVARRMKVGDDPGLDSVRVTLRNLEKKGHVTHQVDGRRHVYAPVVARFRATRTAMSDLTRTFFGGSHKKAIITMLDHSSNRLSEEELEEIARWIEQERRSQS